MRPVDHVVRVFTDPEGRFGNFLGVFLDTADWSDETCQARARALGFSETVFVDDVATGRIRIFTPLVKFPFAGHPTVGTAWLLGRLGQDVTQLVCDAGLVHAVATKVGATVLADPAWCPPFALRQVETPADVEAMVPVPGAHEYVWAWENEATGAVRARAFVGGGGIPEDEATGSAAIRLAAALDRPLRIRQGRGSRIVVGATGGGKYALSGRVSMDS